jgi:hypothetical protein
MESVCRLVRTCVWPMLRSHITLHSLCEVGVSASRFIGKPVAIADGTESDETAVGRYAVNRNSRVIDQRGARSGLFYSRSNGLRANGQHSIRSWVSGSFGNTNVWLYKLPLYLHRDILDFEKVICDLFSKKAV